MSTEIAILIGLALIAATALAWRALEHRATERQQTATDATAASERRARELQEVARESQDRARAAEAPAVHQRVTASLVGNEGGIEGVITEYLPGTLRFEDAKFLAVGKPPEPVEGSVLIDRDRIVLMQVHRA